MKPRWLVFAAAVLLVAVAAITVRSLVDPSDDAPPPPVIGPQMPPGYTVDWVPVGDRVHPCIQYRSSIDCDFTRPSPTPIPDKESK